jgi:hypothetical protein
MSAPTPAPATNAPASTGFLSGLFGAKKANNSPKPANAAAPAAPAMGGRRHGSRKSRSRSRNEGYEERSRKNHNRKNRNRSRKNRK